MNTQRQPLQAVVVGAGYLGRFHAQKYAALPDVDLVAIVDVDLDRARAVALETGAPHACASLADVPGRVDAASVVVPNEAHFNATSALLERGVHVLVEKPVTGDVAQAARLEAMADERRLILQPGFLERFNPAVQFLREHAPHPRFVEAHRLGGFKSRATDVDVVMDLMIHDIDIVLYLIDAPVCEVRASGTAVLTGRLDIWAAVTALIEQRPVLGWGWISYWAPWVEPFDDLVIIRGVRYLQAHNAWLDVLLQLGWIGLIVFTILIVTTGARVLSWSVDAPLGDQAPTPALLLLPGLLLTVLLVHSLAESRLLIEAGFVLLVYLATASRLRGVTVPPVMRERAPEPQPATAPEVSP